MFSKLLDKYISQKNLYFLIFFIVILILLCKNIDIAIMIFVSIIFACALNPLVDKLTKKMNRGLATTIVLLSFLCLMAIFILPVLYLGVYEITEFAKEFPGYVSNLNDTIGNISIFKTLGITRINFDVLANTFTNSSVNIFDSIITFITDASSALLYIFTSLIFLFFFLVDKDKIKDAILKIFPSEYRTKSSVIIDNVENKLSGYVFAQALVSGSVWITMTLGLLIFHINYAILLGLIAGILSIIPVVGSGISLIICLIATYEMGLKALVIVTILYTISHFIENHVVRPYVYSKFLNLHQVIIFLALFIGAKYQGVLGVILAPPFAMALYILLEEIYIKKMDE